MLRTVPGLTATATGARGNALRGIGGCVPRVYVDGVYINGGADDLDGMVSPEDIAGIEVYRGGAGVPVQFDMLGRSLSLTGAAGCGGAIVLWTRR